MFEHIETLTWCGTRISFVLRIRVHSDTGLRTSAMHHLPRSINKPRNTLNGAIDHKAPDFPDAKPPSIVPSRIGDCREWWNKKKNKKALRSEKKVVPPQIALLHRQRCDIFSLLLSAVRTRASARTSKFPEFAASRLITLHVYHLSISKRQFCFPVRQTANLQRYFSAVAKCRSNRFCFSK